jgi:hypothetical protein
MTYIKKWNHIKKNLKGGYKFAKVKNQKWIIGNNEALVNNSMSKRYLIFVVCHVVVKEQQAKACWSEQNK